MRVLVTGATGFVGGHLVRGLAAAGHLVLGVDLNPPGAPLMQYLGADARAVRFIQADISAPGSLERAVDASAEAIIHAAVITSTPDVEASQPRRVVEVNVLGTFEVLRYARTAGTRRFLYVSSSGVYGENMRPAVIQESEPLVLEALYTMTMLTQISRRVARKSILSDFSFLAIHSQTLPITFYARKAQIKRYSLPSDPAGNGANNKISLR